MAKREPTLDPQGPLVEPADGRRHEEIPQSMRGAPDEQEQLDSEAAAAAQSQVPDLDSNPEQVLLEAGTPEKPIASSRGGQFALRRITVVNLHNKSAPHRDFCVPMASDPNDYLRSSSNPFGCQSFERVIRVVEERYWSERRRDEVLASFGTLRAPLAANKSEHAYRPQDHGME